MTEQEAEEYLHEHIPLSLAMGVRVRSLGPEGVRLWLPLGPNINHRQTAFGGSISSAAILAAWTLVHVRLADECLPARIVIQRAATEFLKPVSGDFEAFCPAPDPASWDRFTALLRRRGRARLSLRSVLQLGEDEVGSFEGDFVAIDVGSMGELPGE